jgi:hypothetical protein
VGHDCQSARFAGFAGLKNGALLLAAERVGFDVIITVDQSIPEQQNLRDLQISVLILRARTNRIADLRTVVPAALEALKSLGRGQVVRL